VKDAPLPRCLVAHRSAQTAAEIARSLDGVYDVVCASELAATLRSAQERPPHLAVLDSALAGGGVLPWLMKKGSHVLHVGHPLTPEQTMGVCSRALQLMGGETAEQRRPTGSRRTMPSPDGTRVAGAGAPPARKATPPETDAVAPAAPGATAGAKLGLSVPSPFADRAPSAAAPEQGEAADDDELAVFSDESSGKEPPAAGSEAAGAVTAPGLGRWIALGAVAVAVVGGLFVLRSHGDTSDSAPAPVGAPSPAFTPPPPEVGAGEQWGPGVASVRIEGSLAMVYVDRGIVPLPVDQRRARLTKTLVRLATRGVRTITISGPDGTVIEDLDSMR
jgi:hypothetical protein